MLNYDSIYKDLAGQTVSWLQKDNIDLYHTNRINRFDELEKNGWIDSSFTYKFNSLGFRCEEFTNEPTIMFLGCSNTFGVGIPVESTWSKIVSTELNMRCANLGQSGASFDNAFRLCHGYIDKIQPKLVVFMKPPKYRIEIVNHRSSTFLGTWTQEYSDFYSAWVKDDNNDYFNSEKNMLAMKTLCIERNIKYIVADWNELRNCEPLSLARDLSHPGVKANSTFAKILLTKI